MIIKQTIDGLKVTMDIYPARHYKHEFAIRGTVYPFLDTFHNVKFEVSFDRKDIFDSIENDKDLKAGYSISFGGVTHVGLQATKLVKAAVIAERLATQYAGILDEVIAAKGNPVLVIETIQDKNYNLARVLLSMIPNMTQEVKMRNKTIECPLQDMVCHASFRPILDAIKSYDFGEHNEHSPEMELGFSAIMQFEQFYKAKKVDKPGLEAIFSDFIAFAENGLKP